MLTRNLILEMPSISLGPGINSSSYWLQLFPFHTYTRWATKTRTFYRPTRVYDTQRRSI